MRQSDTALALYRATTGYILPGLALVAIVAAGAVAISRTTVDFREGRGGLCTDSKAKDLVDASETPTVAATTFTIDNLCWASGIQVHKGRQYLLSITMTKPFLDQTQPVDIAGFRASSFNYLLGVPLRRWWASDWFQPIARIGARGDAAWPLVAADGAEAVELGFDADGNKIPATAAGADPKGPHLRKTFVSQFVAPASGELFLYLNDAIAAVPFGPTVTRFYKNNSGSAKVVVERVAPPKIEGE